MEKKSSLSSTLKETEENGGSTTLDGGVICLEKDSDKWIMLTKEDPKMCDHNRDCREGWDENCSNVEDDSTVESDQNEPTEQTTEGQEETPEKIAEGQEKTTEASVLSDTNTKPIHTEPGKETFDPQVNCISDNENISKIKGNLTSS